MLAERGQRPHVGGHEPRSGRLAARALEHGGRDVACGDLVAAAQEGQEALAGAARDVQQPPAREPVLGNQRLERGKKDIQLSTIVRLACGLGVTPAALIEDVRCPEPPVRPTP